MLREPKHFLTSIQLLEIPVLVLIGVYVSEGLGRYSYYIPPENKSSILYKLFVAGQIGILVAFLTRTSITLMLLQLKISTLWRLFFYLAIASQIAIPLALNIALFNMCRPVSTMWEPVSGAKYWNKSQEDIHYYFRIGAAITSDILFAITPAFIIWKLKRSLLERAVIIMLMALGVSASGAVIARAIITANRSPMTDSMRNAVMMLILCRLEDSLLIMA
ncbi:hypothetical protein S7711_08429, partial [Stachybotrys chartarum IBT 7711]